MKGPNVSIQVVGSRERPDTFTVLDFLVRNEIPHRLVNLAIDPSPLVLLEDQALVNPSALELAEALGFTVRASRQNCDLAIIGAGPGGLAAAINAASEGLNPIVIERDAPGGQAGYSSSIENFLGFPSGLTGSDLAKRAMDQASRFGAEIVLPVAADGLALSGDRKLITLSDGGVIQCRSLIIATGVSHRKTGLDNEDRLTGAGVYFGGANTMGTLNAGEDVYVVGGANSAGQAALHLAQFARSVTILVRSPLIKNMSQYLVDRISESPTIRVWERCEVLELHGDDCLEFITLRKDDRTLTLPCAALFVFIGSTPRTDWLNGHVETSDTGFITTGETLESSVPGLFAVGDVRAGSSRRIAGAVGDGSQAIGHAHQYLSR